MRLRPLPALSLALSAAAQWGTAISGPSLRASAARGRGALGADAPELRGALGLSVGADGGDAREAEEDMSDADLAHWVGELSSRGKAGRPVLTVKLENGLGNQLYMIAGLLSTAMDRSPRFSVELPNVSHLEKSWPDFKRENPTYWHSVLSKLRPLLGDVAASPAVLERCKVWQQRPCTPALAAGRACDPDGRYAAGWDADLEKESGCSTFALQGQFINRVYYAKHLPLFRHLFWDAASAERAAARLAELVPDRRRPVVAVHYRLGDFISAGWDLGSDYYTRAVHRVKDELSGNVTCLVFSIDPGLAWERSEGMHGCSARVLVPKEDSDVTSLYMMSQADAMVTAYSTFSFWAAALGRPGRVVVAPSVPQTDSCKRGARVTAEPGWIALPATENR